MDKRSTLMNWRQEMSSSTGVNEEGRWDNGGCFLSAFQYLPCSGTN